LNCPSCGKEVIDDNAIYCPYCTKPLRLLRKRTGLPIAGGILTIIAACVSIIGGVIGMAAFISFLSWSYYYYYRPIYQVLFMGVFGILAFALGLTGGIFSLKRRHFALSIIGTSFVVVSGVITMEAIAITGSWSFGLLLGLPPVLLSILGLIFVAISKGEFA